MYFPIQKLAMAEYSAELMVYFEKHKIIEIITRLMAEIGLIRPTNPQHWIAKNIRRIADEFYHMCLKASYTNSNIDYYQLPRRFHHRIVVFGRSGSGRKTQALAMTKRFNLVYIDADQLIHATFFLNDGLSRLLHKAFADNVAKDKSMVVAEIIQRRLAQMDALRQGWVLINYPHNVEEFTEMFEKFKIPPNKLVYLQCPELMALRRLVTKPDLGCPQNKCKYIEHEMRYFSRNEATVNEYLARRHETIYIDATRCFEAVRTNLWRQMERLPYVMGYKS
ncbi:adenylate kinase-like [Rhagoletis pomonella]|uniref:adenylate kinase-like n=1 Tax=Rhagoletis pomonella TaxID=28610 RepID=UPI001784130B|nr:adenylate kinase-like [Rhagoletis pomonella]